MTHEFDVPDVLQVYRYSRKINNDDAANAYCSNDFKKEKCQDLSVA